jgi:hypothetical protein
MKRENIGMALAIQNKLQYLEQWISALENKDKLEIIIRNPNGPEDDRVLIMKQNFDLMSKMPMPTNEQSDALVDWVRAYFMAEKIGLMIKMEEL